MSRAYPERPRARRHRLCRRRAVAADRRTSAARACGPFCPTASRERRSARRSRTCASAYPTLKFAGLEEIERSIAADAASAPCSARRPHGVAAALIDRLLRAAEDGGVRTHCVDISADFRYASAGAYEAVYKHAHGAPARIRAIHLRGAGTSAGGADAARGPSRLLCDRRAPRQRAAARAGADRRPAVHHRHHRQHGFGPQAGRRHAPSPAPRRSLQLRRARPPPCAGNRRLRGKRVRASTAEINFVPHSGPFARGIHVTVQAALKKPLSSGAGARGARRRIYRAVRSSAWSTPLRGSRMWPPAITRICAPSPTALPLR